VLYGHQHRAAPFAANTEPLRETQHHQRDGGPRADLSIGRQQADTECCDTHDDQRQDEHRLASDSVAVVADHDPANRAGDESHGVRAERRQRPREWIERREEQPVENKRSGSAV
jgi:hypothetical protein